MTNDQNAGPPEAGAVESPVIHVPANVLAAMLAGAILDGVVLANRAEFARKPLADPIEWPAESWDAAGPYTSELEAEAKRRATETVRTLTIGRS